MNWTVLAQQLLDDSAKDGFAGYDPFDGLNGSLFSVWPSAKDSLLGLAFIQLCKRSPINFRPLLGVLKARNPKGVALFVSGLLQDHRRTGDPQLLQQALELGDWLLTQQCDALVWQHPCWGYHFDWKARAFYVPKGKPNVITTIYVSRALYELGLVANRTDLCQAALNSAHFIVEHLRTQDAGKEFFAYIPGETAFVHNASLWAAAWVAFAASKTGNSDHAELALRVARQSVQMQAADGSWVYGTRHHHQFIDGFHTGYNLEALHDLRTALDVTEFDGAISQGLAFYKEHLFEANGAAKYFHNNPYPYDMHTVAQAVLTLLRVGGTASDVALVEKTLDWSIKELYLPNQQRFAYQKTARWTNKVNYMRWTQAWAYFAIAFYNRHQAEQHGTH